MSAKKEQEKIIKHVTPFEIEPNGNNPGNSVDTTPSIKDSCKYSDATLVFGALLTMGVITLIIEFSQKVITDGIITSIAIIGLSLIYFGGLLSIDIWRIIRTTHKNKWAYILLFINICVNVGVMIAFISIFFPPEVYKKINNKDVLSSLNPTINGFLSVLCIYIFLNYYIYTQVKCKTSNINIIIFVLIMFASTECIIQILLLVMINSYLYKITDG
jgi:hypothetical protein